MGLSELVAAYDSEGSEQGSDSEEATGTEPKKISSVAGVVKESITSPVDGIAKEATKGTKSKRYLAAAALLPKEIRAALEGKFEDDEDDDWEERAAPPGQLRGEAITRPGGASSHGLLSILPAARGDQSTRSLPPPSSYAVDTVGEVEEESDNDEDIPAQSVVSAPKNWSDAVRREAVRTDAPDRTFSAAKIQDSSADAPVMAASRKRRALESALMEGDVSALQGVEIEDVSARVETRTAEQLAATSEFTPDVRVAASFYNPKTGTNIMTLRPSKLQRRRHQINSLAVTAAERELDLLERRNLSMKTKRHTQSRYGW